MVTEWKVLETLAKFNMQMPKGVEGWHFGFLKVQSDLVSRIIEVQEKDEKFQLWFAKLSAKDLAD